jgi:zinc transport system substrate-binding protein
MDPHIWLSPKNAKLMVNNIKNGLMAADPKNADVYLANAQKLSQELDELDAEYKTGLAACAKDVVLVNHNAFSYLARDYGFEIITIHGLEPEAEPTPGQLQELIEEAKEHDIKYVFYEELVDPRVAQTIANEVGAQTLELNPLESGSSGDNYVALMQENLENLQLALECE